MSKDRIEKKINNQTKSTEAQDVLNEIENKPFGTTLTVEVAGRKAIVKKYDPDDAIFNNYNFKDGRTGPISNEYAEKLHEKMVNSGLYNDCEVPSPQRIKESTNGENWYSKLDEDKKNDVKEEVAGHRRKKRLEMLAAANTDKWQTMIDLTFGIEDYAELCKEKLSSKQLEWLSLERLKGVKSIFDIDDDQLRDQVRKYLSKATNRRESIKTAVEKYPEVDLDVEDDEVMRKEVCKSLDDMVSKASLESIEQINHEFDLFRRKMNRLMPKDKKFKYLLVFELGVKNERIHCHMLTNVRFIPQYILQRKWGQGITEVQSLTYDEGCKIKDKDAQEKAISYVTKYATKQVKSSNEEEEEKSKKWFENKNKYRMSRGLKKSQKVSRSRESKAVKETAEKIGNKVYENYVDNSDEEYRKSYTVQVYELPSREVYEAIRELRNKYAIKMLELSDKATQREFDSIRSNYEEELEGKLYQIQQIYAEKQGKVC